MAGTSYVSTATEIAFFMLTGDDEARIKTTQ